MLRVQDYILSVLYYIYFSSILLIFHPIQYVAYNVFGHKAQQRMIQLAQMFLLKGLFLAGSRVVFLQKPELDLSKKYLIITNHQSFYDIIGLLWHLRDIYPIFVAKKELGHGIPSVSYNLRMSGAALIDRKDRRQSMKEISRMSKHALDKGYTPVIFPEGTRSSSGRLRSFSKGGIGAILRAYQPDYILPIHIHNTAQLCPKKSFPIRAFTKVVFEPMPLIKVDAETGMFDIDALEAEFKVRTSEVSWE